MSCDVIEVFGSDTADYRITFRNRNARTFYDLTAFTGTGSLDFHIYANEAFGSGSSPSDSVAMTVLVPPTDGQATFSINGLTLAVGTYGYRIAGTDGSGNTFTLKRGKLIIT